MFSDDNKITDTIGMGFHNCKTYKEAMCTIRSALADFWLTLEKALCFLAFA